MQICPIATKIVRKWWFIRKAIQIDCRQMDCVWWCNGENTCSIKVIALELIKKGES